MKFKGSQRHIGYYEGEEEAARAYDAFAVARGVGERANFPVAPPAPKPGEPGRAPGSAPPAARGTRSSLREREKPNPAPETTETKSPKSVPQVGESHTTPTAQSRLGNPARREAGEPCPGESRTTTLDRPGGVNATGVPGAEGPEVNARWAGLRVHRRLPPPEPL
eukprot:383479-Prorocentrum_minimum.AAC.1